MANIEVLRDIGVDQHRVPEPDIALKMAVPGFESKSIWSSISYHILRATCAVGLAVVRKQDHNLSEAHMQRFLDTWCILQPRERDMFLNAHQARSLEIKKVCRWFSVLSANVWC